MVTDIKKRKVTIVSTNKELRPESKTLKTLLFDSSITYVQLAKRLGISENNLTFKINGRRKWWIDECVAIVGVLNSIKKKETDLEGETFLLLDLKAVFPETFKKVLG